jgi:cysteine desulfurase
MVSMEKPNIYMDYGATTPVDPDVREAMLPYFSDIFGNASSVHAYGRKAKAVLERSREIIAAEIGAHPGEILFTSGGTESDNMALIGIASVMKRRGKTHVITSSAEHRAVLDSTRYLETVGFNVTYLPVSRFGKVDAPDLIHSIRPETGLVSLMHANNELGTLNDIEELSVICKSNEILMHSDSVQSFAKISLDVRDVQVDLLSFSAHKIYGPKGIGALFIRKGTEIDTFIHGGGQERGRRGGTENVALAAGFAKAVELMQRNRKEENTRLHSLRQKLFGRLTEYLPGIQFNTDINNSLPHVLNISFDASLMRIDGEALLIALDTGGLSVSNGSACTSGSLEPSHVQLAIGNDRNTAKSAIRFSLGRYTTENEVQSAAEIVRSVIARIARPVKPLNS